MTAQVIDGVPFTLTHGLQQGKQAWRVLGYRSPPAGELLKRVVASYLATPWTVPFFAVVEAAMDTLPHDAHGVLAAKELYENGRDGDCALYVDSLAYDPTYTVADPVPQPFLEPSNWLMDRLRDTDHEAAYTGKPPPNFYSHSLPRSGPERNKPKRLDWRIRGRVRPRLPQGWRGSMYAPAGEGMRFLPFRSITTTELVEQVDEVGGADSVIFAAIGIEWWSVRRYDLKEK